MDFINLAQQYKKELLNNLVPFWENHSKDEEFGGYFTSGGVEAVVWDDVIQGFILLPAGRELLWVCSE
jgi:mannose/cellobiose epimerase-like protein (N-acyl-D-glucosamine 2-epimerase family)